jgi:hypothetical protein
LFLENPVAIRRPNHADDGEHGAMTEPTIRFPVACPECGIELLTAFPVSVVADALLRGANISLMAACHNAIWDASDLELEQIREYLGTVWLDAQRCSRSGT